MEAPPSTARTVLTGNIPNHFCIFSRRMPRSGREDQKPEEADVEKPEQGQARAFGSDLPVLEYELAAQLRDQEQKLRDRIGELEHGWHNQQTSEQLEVNEEDVAEVVAAWRIL